MQNWYFNNSDPNNRLRTKQSHTYSVGSTIEQLNLMIWLVYHWKLWLGAETKTKIEVMSWKFLKYLWWVVSISKKSHWNWVEEDSYLLIRNVIGNQLISQLKIREGKVKEHDYLINVQFTLKKHCKFFRCRTHDTQSCFILCCLYSKVQYITESSGLTKVWQNCSV